MVVELGKYKQKCASVSVEKCRRRHLTSRFHQVWPPFTLSANQTSWFGSPIHAMLIKDMFAGRKAGGRCSHRTFPVIFNTFQAYITCESKSGWRYWSTDYDFFQLKSCRHAGSESVGVFSIDIRPRFLLEGARAAVGCEPWRCSAHRIRRNHDNYDYYSLSSLLPYDYTCFIYHRVDLWPPSWRGAKSMATYLAWILSHTTPPIPLQTMSRAVERSASMEPQNASQDSLLNHKPELDLLHLCPPWLANQKLSDPHDDGSLWVHAV